MTHGAGRWPTGAHTRPYLATSRFSREPTSHELVMGLAELSIEGKLIYQANDLIYVDSKAREMQRKETSLPSRPHTGLQI